MAKLTQKYLESILPHQAGEKVRDEGKVRRHYLHHDYAAEKKAAWKLLGEYLSQSLHLEQNIISFKAAMRAD